MRKFLSALIRSSSILQKCWGCYKIHSVSGYDCNRFYRCSGVTGKETKDSLRAQVMMAYHGIEKGLTMPHKRFPFGRDSVLHLIKLLTLFSERYGVDDQQFRHAVGVLKDYRWHCDQHAPVAGMEDLLRSLDSFLAPYEDVPVSAQGTFSKEAFFSACESSFPEFAASRHVVRHYVGPVPLERIERAVEIAMTTPSACNRQHTRVHCVVNRDLMKKVLTLQPGNRGFGDDADKLLVITADQACLRWVEERHDLYINAGLFVMNLSYALHYLKVAHCYLSCAVPVKDDVKIRQLLGLLPSEELILMITCGEAPAQFEVAASPKRSGREILTVH